MAKGVNSPFKGRPPSIDAVTVSKLSSEGYTPTAIAKELSIACSSVYRYLNNDRK